MELPRLSALRHALCMLALTGGLFVVTAGPASAANRSCGTTSASASRFKVVVGTWGMGKQDALNCATARRLVRKVIRRGRGGRYKTWFCNFGNRPTFVCTRGASGGQRVSAYLEPTPTDPKPDAGPRGKHCGSLSLGTALFGQIRAVGVSCRRAKSLIDRATLASNRGGHTSWSYGGFEWSVKSIDETSTSLRAKRDGDRITALWQTA